MSTTQEEKPFSVYRCEVCKGRGTVNWGKEECKACGGKGYIVLDNMTGLPVKGGANGVETTNTN